MANNRNVYQQKTTVSIPKEELLNHVVYNFNLGKKDLRLCLFLFTQLDGYSEPDSRNYSDPKNFTFVNAKKIANTLDMSKKDVEKCIENLINEGIIEEGHSEATKGYRFTF
jgi:biotin operon repressor